MLKKENRWKNKKYRQWVTEQPSVISGQYGCDPHHIKGHGLSGGVVAPDLALIPLTREEHTLFHSMPAIEWEANYGSQTDHLMRFWLYNWDEIQGFFSE